LDVGTGTGRVIRYISERLPDVKIVGIEPDAALRDIALNEHGLPESAILKGNGLDIPFPDQSFDIVCEFAVLHHVQKPEKVVSEMLRVARKAFQTKIDLLTGLFSSVWQNSRYAKLACFQLFTGSRRVARDTAIPKEMESPTRTAYSTHYRSSQSGRIEPS
jgi:ubiquinone/menaquinone biosynthesis C-methylase UbiE